MRVVAWLLLLISFTIGLISAFVVAYFTFDAKPVTIVDRGPTVKILVAQQEIPIGTEITADYITFKDVPVSEIPAQAMTNFMQVYRRRPAYPLIAGCPICEDLLLPNVEAQGEESTKYLPAGSKVVSLEVEHLRVGSTVSEFEIPLGNVFSIGDRIDIRVIPHQNAKGEYIERKNLVLRTFAEKNGVIDAGRLVLENVGIYGIVGKQSLNSGKQIQTVSLLLEKGQAQKLTDAAREGRLRIVPNQEQARKAESDDSPQTADNRAADASHEKIRHENTSTTVRSDVPQEKPVRTSEAPFAVPKQPIRLLDSSRSITESARFNREPIRDREVVSMENTVPASGGFERSHGGASVSFVAPKVASSEICNESVSAAPVRSAFRQRSASPQQRIIEIGLPQSEAFETQPVDQSRIAERSMLENSSSDYSPFGRSGVDRVAEPEDEPLPQPLPLKTRFR